MKKRILACLLALVMLIGAMPVMALAAEPEAEKPASFDWEVSKSKTATALDADGSTRVTLSLPSAEETLTSDVVFVLDGSSSADANVVKESLKLLDELKQAAKVNGATVNVCIVKFKRQAFKSDWFDLATNFEDIEKQCRPSILEEQISMQVFLQVRKHLKSTRMYRQAESI